MTESGAESPDDSEEEIPKLPRAPLFGKPSLNGVVRIGMFATLLYAIIVMGGPCADGVGRFVGGFGTEPDAAPVDPAEHYPGYQLITAEEFMKRYPDGGAEDSGLGDASASAPKATKAEAISPRATPPRPDDSTREP